MGKRPFLPTSASPCGIRSDIKRFSPIGLDRPRLPTAGLHFTEGVLRSLKTRGIDLVAVELEVGLDTFRPIGVDRISDHVMHAERYTVPVDTAAAIMSTRRSEGRVVAVGTTVVRTLEAAFDGGEVIVGNGSTDLFITPGYRFGIVDLLVTNFHVPSSTLIGAAAPPSWGPLGGPPTPRPRWAGAIDSCRSATPCWRSGSHD